MIRGAVMAIALLLGAPALACEGTRLGAIVAASSPGKLVAEIDAEDVQSSEGAAWRIYNGSVSGQPVNIIRTIYGEMGRREDRLVIAAPQAYAVVVTDYRYSAPITDLNMRASVSSRSVYMFCEGVVQRPGGITNAAFEAHKAKAQEARLVFGAREIADHVSQVQLAD